MGRQLQGLFDQLGLSNRLKRWKRDLRDPAHLSGRDLDAMLRQMRRLRGQVDGLAADTRAELLARAAPLREWVRLPDQCDWLERASPWTGKMAPRCLTALPSPTKLADGVTLFHDSAQADLSLRQDPTPPGSPGAPFGLVFEVYQFDGSFLSVVQDLPDRALQGLTRNHLVALHLRVDHESPLEIYARLNVRHGPNTEQIVRQVRIDGDRGAAEFDLAYSKINEKKIEKAWLDLILDRPAMNRIALWDMVLLRAPRADV